MKTALLTLLLLFVAHRPAEAQLYTPSGSVAIAEYHETAWAITVCGSRPITWYSDDLPESERGMVTAHEAEHRRFMSTFPSCAAFRSWNRATPENELAAEARAFCAGARHDVMTRKYPSMMVSVWAHAKVLATYGLWDPDEAAVAIYRNC